MTTSIDWNKELVDQLDWHWGSFVRPRLEGLTDAEFQWEPVPGCWSTRPRGAPSPATAVGTKAGTIDFALPQPNPAPFTTIAWRLAHLTYGVFGQRAHDHFGYDGGFTRHDDVDYPVTAAHGLAELDRSYTAWTEGARALGPDGLLGPCGPAEGPFTDSPLAALILHINREGIHHSAEILALRDLYRTAGRPDGPLVP